MEVLGLVGKISEAVLAIDFGRKGFSIEGKEREGRISYETGIARALSAFQEAQISTDPQALLLAEYTFLTQEFELCDETDKAAINSLSKAIQSFDDAFFALNAVEKSGYKTADETYPHDCKYRVGCYPKDAYHIAFIAHRTRLNNILRTPGIDPIEKTLLKQRLANLSTAQNAYVEKQKKVLGEK